MAERYHHEFDPNHELSKIFTELWRLDDNRLKPGTDYMIDLQGYTRPHQRRDRANEPLFSYVNPTILEKPTFKSFIALLDNYESSTGVREDVTREEIMENRNFIDQIMKTKVMNKAHEYLASCGKSDRDIWKFKHQLYDIWFKLYCRSKHVRVPDSSGFEHVFVGETSGKEVIGFHNWIQFYLQEQMGNVDYQGYIRRGKQQITNDSPLLTVQFKWKSETKPIGSTFIGTSPEFEIALYTIAFLCCPEPHVDVIINGLYVTLTCYRHWNNYLGTSYPTDKS
jgi:hypothetical protein